MWEYFVTKRCGLTLAFIYRQALAVAIFALCYSTQCVTYFYCEGFTMKMVKWFILLVLAPSTALAASEMGIVNTDVGATLITENGEQEVGYFFQVGYAYRVSTLLSAEATYKKVETLNSSVSAESSSFVRNSEAFGLGVRIDYPTNLTNVYGRFGGSYITSETTTWDSTLDAESIRTDTVLKPYVAAGVTFLSQFGLVMDAGFSFQMLENGEHETSFYSGTKFVF